MSDGPFRVVDVGGFYRWAVMSNASAESWAFHKKKSADNRRELANSAWRRANGPSLTEQRDEAVEAAKHLLSVLDAHEIDTLDCDRRGVKYCECLSKAAGRLAAAIKGGGE